MAADDVPVVDEAAAGFIFGFMSSRNRNAMQPERLFT
jgi:hypothetical protein